MKIYTLGVAGAVALMVAASGAQAGQGWYIAGGAGGQIVDDTTSTVSDIFGNFLLTDTSFDLGYGVNGALGYSWDSHGANGGGAVFRIEGEVLYRVSDVDRLDRVAIVQTFLGPFILAGSFEGTGDVSTLGLMANAWYEFSTGMPWRPYLGGGLGMANISLNDVGLISSGTEFALADDDDWVFAYQFGVGMNYEITPQIIAGIEYRFFATTDPEFVDLNGFEFSGQTLVHNFGLIIRFLF